MSINRRMVSLAALFVVMVALAVAGVERSGGRAEAQAVPTVDLLAIDAVTAGNTATSLGTIEDCAVVTPGGTHTVDIVVDSIPAEGLASFGTDVLYDPAILRVAAVDYNLLLVAAGGGLFAFADSLPDTDGDYRADIADLTQNYEVGEGVLMRLTFEAVGTGLSPVILADEIQQDGTPEVLMPSGEPYAINEIRAGSISVGGSCPTPSDLQVTAATVTSPASATAGEATTVGVEATIVNTGPFGPVNADVAATLQMPSDCSAVEPMTQTQQDFSLAVATPVTVTYTYTVTCTNASFHTFEASVSLTVDDAAGSDSNPANNVRQATLSTTAVFAEADLSLGAVTIETQPTVFVGMQFTATATVPVTNGGPYGPATANLSLSLTATGCDIYSPNPGSTTAQVGNGATEPASVSWNVVCDDYGTYTLAVAASADVGELHVADPATPNSSNGSLPIDVFAGACGPDPAPAGDILQNMSPQLIALIGQLTETGTPVPPEYQKPLSCLFDHETRDVANTPIDDCAIGLLVEQPCSMSFEVNLDQPGGSPAGIPSVRTAPVGVNFLPSAYDWANDTEVPNGSANSVGDFRIRTDGALLPNGTPCVISIRFDPENGYEGAIQGNAPESNSSNDLANPHVWPNDLNAERALAEASFKVHELLPTGVTLWSRTIIPLDSFGMKLPLNVLTWRIHDPVFQTVTGAEWVVIPFPGDALADDTPGTIGDPDADDPDPGPVPITTCMPYGVRMSISGMAGGVPLIACTTPGSHMTWALLDPDARAVTGDEGPRSGVATCGLDADGDGISQDSETYWGTNALSTDSDGDGVLDGPDNCRTTANAGQEDLEGDAIGDICDPDDENDGDPDASDNCPVTVNPGQENAVHPGTTAGDHCEDPEPDGVMDVSDNCPDAANPGQENDIHTESPPGDHCDDPESDGVADISDNCVDVANPGQENYVHPVTPAGDHCDDPDDDSHVDFSDNCPDASNPGQENGDGDSIGDACEAAHCLSVPNYWSSPAEDGDCDGFPATTTAGARGSESFIGTDAIDQCPDSAADNAWPPDVNNSGFVNLTDVVLFGPTFNEMGPNPPYNARFDLNASNGVNLSDVVGMGPFFNKACTP